MQVTEAHELYQQLIQLLKISRLSGIRLGQVLWQLNANELYQDAIGSVDSWFDFLKLPEIGLSVREANRAMDMYGEFVIKLEIPMEDIADAKTKSLHYLLPLVKSDTISKERALELVEDAKHLSQAQFKENLYDAKVPGGVRTYHFALMRKCNETGTMQKVLEVTEDMLKDSLKSLYKIDLDKVFMPEVI